MPRDRALRAQLKEVLAGHGAHVPFDEAVRAFPPELRGKKARGLPYSAWQLVEHLRIALWDLVEYSRWGEHVSPEWPDEYWPASAAPPDATAWDTSLAEFRRQLRRMVRLVENPATDLLAPLPWSDIGATVLREALLAADHNAYHVGQLVALRRCLGIWNA